MKDTRDITLTDVKYALDLLLTEDSSETLLTEGVYYKSGKFSMVNHLHSKLSMFDATGYGIDAGVKMTFDGKVGVVERFVHDKVWAMFGLDSLEFNTLDVLLYANPGQGVVSLEEDRRKFVFFLCTVFAIVVTHVSNFVDSDAKMTRKDGVYTDLAASISKLKTLKTLTTEKAKDLSSLE